MKAYKPGWWKSEYDSGWGRVKEAFSRDWEQTKHDLGSKSAPNLHQGVSDTVKQMTAQQPLPTDFAGNEKAFIWGYGARQHFADRTWDSTLETELAKDYGTNWDRDRAHVRHAFDYKYKH